MALPNVDSSTVAQDAAVSALNITGIAVTAGQSLIVQIGLRENNDANRSIDSVVWDDGSGGSPQSLTQTVRATNDNANHSAESWELRSAGINLSNSRIVITCPAAQDRIVGVAHVIAAGHRAVPIDVSASDVDENSAAPSISATTTGPDRVMIAAHMVKPGGVWQATEHTELTNTTAGGNIFITQSVNKATAGAQAMGLTLTNATDDTVSVVVAVKKVPTRTIWTGATDGDLSDPTNWSNGLPVDEDIAIFANSAVDVNISVTALAAVVLAGLFIHRSYTGVIASAAAPMEVGATTLIINQRAGGCHLEGAFARAYVRSTPGVADSVTLGTDGSVEILSDLYVLATAGRLKVRQSAFVARVHIARGASANVFIDDSVQQFAGPGTMLGEINVRGGFVETESGADDVRVFGGGRVRFTGDQDNGNVLVGRGRVDAHSGDPAGGRFIDGTLTVLENGGFSLAGNENPVVTIDDLVTTAGSRIDLRTSTRAAVVTNGISYRGGRVRFDRGVTLTPA